MPTTPSRQLPLVLGLATWLILTHFGTAYGFDPGAGRTNAPPPIVPFTPDYLTALSIGYYKIASGVLSVIFESSFDRRLRALVCLANSSVARHADLLFVIGNTPAAAAFTNQTPLLVVTVVQSLDHRHRRRLLVARYDPYPLR